MLKFLLRRLVQAVFVILGVSVITFMLLHLTGDPVDLMVPLDAGPEARQEIRASLGLDQPLPAQYARFLGGAIHFDFGPSLFQTGRTAMVVVGTALPNTLLLAIAAFLIALLIAFPVGILSAVRRHSAVDHLGMIFALLGQSIPVFLLGTLFIWIFAVNLGWLPAEGMHDSRGQALNDFWDLPKHLILPSLTLGLFVTARQVRLVRSSLIEVLGQDYIRTAHAKGLGYRAVVGGHALKNALIPIVTVLGLDLATLLSGAVITESVFSWPGVGRAAVDAINQHDFPVVQAIVFTVALGYVLLNLGVDLLYAYLNPRIRFG